MTLNTKEPNKSNLETEAKESVRIMKFIAPKIISINGYPSPCECTDVIACAYCVQASLIYFEKKAKADDRTTTNIILYIRKSGIRKTARDLSIDHSTVKYWLKSRNIPQWIVKKYAGVGE